MTLRHHANTKLTIFSNSATQSSIATKKNHLSSTYLQAEIGKISLGASCCDVMTSQPHAVGLNQNLSTVSGTWRYGKMTLLVEAKIFSYKIIVILCHNVNFDVTIIMTSFFPVDFRMVL